MFAESIAIMLLYVSSAMVHCAHQRSNTELCEEIIHECCFDSITSINDHQDGCNLKNSSRAVAMISPDASGNISDVSCCTNCVENTFEIEDGSQREIAKEQEGHVNAVTRSEMRRFCLKCYISNDRIVGICKECKSNESDHASNANFTKISKWRENSRITYCDNVFTSLNFWGANIVIFANIIYIIPYLIVVLVYFVVPGVARRAYNRAVICYNATQIILNGILIGLGTCVLCHVSIRSNIYVILGLVIMFLTISSTFWLFVICIDMTLVITRFRWTLPTDTNQREERKKFITYASWTWAGSLLPTALAGIAELSPLFPKSSPVRPNFQKFKDGANLAVILYVTTFPALTCLANTILFCYTSYKMIAIQRSTTLATENSSSSKINTVKKRYFLFLRLYLLMDAPWVTSALAAALDDLWILKFLRMIQPILMLLAILPPRTMSRIFPCSCLFEKSNCTLKREQSIG